MKSGKQRRQELLLERKRKAAKKESAGKPQLQTVPCNPGCLAPYNSYGEPAFVQRGYYQDRPFQCKDCGVQELWRATQQKWWYEVAKGNVDSLATRCRACRRKERERKANARRISEQGMEKKRAQQ